MSPHISDLFDLADLAQAVDDGHVRVQVHPSLPLKIINYTERAQYERVLSYIDLGNSEGADLLAGGKPARVDGFEHGLFIEPTFFTNVINRTNVWMV